MGYTHGKKGAPAPKPRYIEDRIAALEDIVNTLVPISQKLLAREKLRTERGIKDIETEIAAEEANLRKLKRLRSAKRKPIKKPSARRS